MIEVRNIRWLAGLLEGEGSFAVDRRQKQLRITVAMTDRDVVERVSSIMGMPIRRQTPSRPDHLALWRVECRGSWPAGWMMMLYGLMGRRRRAQIRDALAAWKTWGTRQEIAEGFLRRRRARLTKEDDR